MLLYNQLSNNYCLLTFNCTKHMSDQEASVYIRCLVLREQGHFPGWLICTTLLTKALKFVPVLAGTENNICMYVFFIRDVQKGHKQELKRSKYEINELVLFSSIKYHSISTNY